MLSDDEIAAIDRDGFADVDCSHDCGEGRRIEPDGDEPCPCGGRFTSPLILEGLI